MKVIYRISNGSYKKERFDFIDKEICLRNFVACGYGLPKSTDLIILADRCDQFTLNMIYRRALIKPVEINVGNGAGSWKYAALYAMGNFPKDEIVYFVEDDYLHRSGFIQILKEGMEIADYVTLYDHPDKYLDADKGGNAYVAGGGEVTRVYRTKSTHWKLTNSTTMTFATTVKTLEEDWDVWEKATETSHPNDFGAFIELAHKQRHLVSPIPAYSTHCEIAWGSPGIDWKELAHGYSKDSL